MDKEKEIDEMAKVMCGGCPNNKECMHCLCQDWYNAEALYNAGYRKQSENLVEVVRCYDCKYCEIVMDSIIDEPKYFCTRMVGSIPVDPTDYCSRAKMKGSK